MKESLVLNFRFPLLSLVRQVYILTWKCKTSTKEIDGNLNTSFETNKNLMISGSDYSHTDQVNAENSSLALITIKWRFLHHDTFPKV